MALPRFLTQNLRHGRYSAAGQIYLVTTVTLNRANVFHDLYHGRCVVAALRRAEPAAQTLAYVVMYDHLHWLMQLKEGHRLSSVVQLVKSTSARSLNRYRNGQGAVWSKGFHDRALRKEEDVKDYARYIVANPLRAGIVGSVREYSLWDAIWL